MVAPGFKVCVCLATLIIVAAISRFLHTSDDADCSTLQAKGRDLRASSLLTSTAEPSTLPAGPMEGTILATAEAPTDSSAEPSTLPVGPMEGVILAMAKAPTGSTAEPSTLPVGPMEDTILAMAEAPTDSTAEPSTLPVGLMEGAILATAAAPTGSTAEPSTLPVGPVEGAILATAKAPTDSTAEPSTLPVEGTILATAEGAILATAEARIDSTTEPSMLPTGQMETKYCVRYEGNQSKRWDGREITLDGAWLESLYRPAELIPGKQLSLPWHGKGGRVQSWKAVLISSTCASTPSSHSGEECNIHLRVWGGGGGGGGASVALYMRDVDATRCSTLDILLFLLFLWLFSIVASATQSA